jgi:hypothetical protein
MSEGQRDVVRKFIKDSSVYRKSTDLVLGLLNGDVIDLPAADEGKPETCVWSAPLSDEELSRLSVLARGKGISWSKFIRDALFARKHVQEPVRKPEPKPVLEPVGKPMEDDAVSTVEEPQSASKQALKVLSFVMTEGQRTSIRRCITESPDYRSAGDLLLAVALDEASVITDIDENLNNTVTWQAQISADVKEILEEVSRENGLSTSAFVRKSLFGVAKKTKAPREVEAVPVEEVSEQATVSVPVPPKPVPKPSGKVFTKEAVLKEAYDLDLLHTHLMSVMPDTLRKFDGAGDEETTARSLEEIADLANLYARITPAPSEFWRTLLRTADDIRLPTSSYHRLLVWAGTLETTRLTMMR